MFYFGTVSEHCESHSSFDGISNYHLVLLLVGADVTNTETSAIVSFLVNAMTG